MSKDIELDEKVMDLIEKGLNDLAESAQESSERSIGPELALSCASLAAQLAFEGGTTEAEFAYLMKTIWESISEPEDDELKIFAPLTAKEKAMLN